MPVTTKSDAMKQQERAMELLREVRQWVWANRALQLPTDSDEPVTRFEAEGHAMYSVWFHSLKDGMHIIDPGFDD